MNGNDYGQMMAQSAQQGMKAGLGQWSSPPKSIMQQLRDKAESLRASLADVDERRKELAQCERMLAAAEEPTPEQA